MILSLLNASDTSLDHLFITSCAIDVKCKELTNAALETGAFRSTVNQISKLCVKCKLTIYHFFTICDRQTIY